MSDQADGGKSPRQSSPRYPFINLHKAIERAEELRVAAGSNYALALDARKTWGYGPKSSGGDQTIAALSYYGMIEDTGTGEARKVKLTDTAIRCLRDERAEVRQDLLAKFALNPRAMQTLWGLWKHEPPSDAIARSILKNDLGYSDWAANELLSIYRENLGFIPRDTPSQFPDNSVKPSTEKSEGGEAPERESKAAPKLGDYIQWSPDGVDQFKPPRRVEWISPDGSYLRVAGSATGIPVGQTTFAPTPPAHGGVSLEFVKPSGDAPEISVLLSGNRLQISANVDEAGLVKLKELISKYEEILKILK